MREPLTLAELLPDSAMNSTFKGDMASPAGEAKGNPVLMVLTAVVARLMARSAPLAKSVTYKISPSGESAKPVG
jgi:hypothetical protein